MSWAAALPISETVSSKARVRDILMAKHGSRILTRSVSEGFFRFAPVRRVRRLRFGLVCRQGRALLVAVEGGFGRLLLSLVHEFADLAAAGQPVADADRGDGDLDQA